jgi:hypothetical protein
MLNLFLYRSEKPLLLKKFHREDAKDQIGFPSSLEEGCHGDSHGGVVKFFNRPVSRRWREPPRLKEGGETMQLFSQRPCGEMIQNVYFII